MALGAASPSAAGDEYGDPFFLNRPELLPAAPVAMSSCPASDECEDGQTESQVLVLWREMTWRGAGHPGGVVLLARHRAVGDSAHARNRYREANFVEL